MESADEYADQVRSGWYSGHGLRVCVDPVVSMFKADFPISASAAVIVRIPYLHDYKDEDFLCKSP